MTVQAMKAGAIEFLIKLQNRARQAGQFNRSVAASNKDEIFSVACVKLKSIRLTPTIGGK
jgi:hypothetical protein